MCIGGVLFYLCPPLRSALASKAGSDLRAERMLRGAACRPKFAPQRNNEGPNSDLRNWRKRRSDAPLSPVCRPHGDELLGTRFHPAGENAPARKNQRMRAIIIYDRQFEIAVEGGVRDRLPVHDVSRCLRLQQGSDPSQNFRKIAAYPNDRCH